MTCETNIDNEIATLHDLISQYKYSPNLIKYIKTFIDEAAKFSSNIKDLEKVLDIDCASGKWLDLIGSIVGQPRIWIDASAFPWFGFEDNGNDPLQGGFDEGKFWDGIQPLDGTLSLIDDDTYKKVIKSRILKNSTNGTHNDILLSLEYILNRNDLRLVGTNGIEGDWFGFEDTGGENLGFGVGLFWDGMEFYKKIDDRMKYQIIAPDADPLDTIDKVLLLDNDLLPTPAGVKLTDIIP